MCAVRWFYCADAEDDEQEQRRRRVDDHVVTRQGVSRAVQEYQRFPVQSAVGAAARQQGLGLRLRSVAAAGRRRRFSADDRDGHRAPADNRRRKCVR